jgi:hypothetical protein
MYTAFNLLKARKSTALAALVFKPKNESSIMTNWQQQPPQLEYPQILLDISLESLLSHSNASTMTSSGPELHIEHDNLLSESWATLSNSDYSREDDLRSETTDVGSLVSNNGAEDIHSIEDDSESEGDEEQPSSNDDDEPQQASDPLAHQLPPASTSLAHEGTTILETDQLSVLEFQEPRMDGWPEAGQIDVKHTIRIFNEAEARQVLGTVEPSTIPAQIVGTVRMSMSRTSLELDRPFRVFYVGNPTARDDILVKIASALLAGVDQDSGYRDVESSRYHVLPQHYGPGAPSGGADLVPVQKTQMVIDEIISAYYKDENQSEIEVSLKNGSHYSSKLKDSTFEITSATQSFVPDIALFYTSEDDSPVLRQNLNCAHRFMLRHHIPSMIITGEVSWISSSNLLPLKLQCLHICVESKASETQESRILRRLPIDFSTFEKIDSKQLNKNLACLIDPALLTAPAIIPRSTPLAKSKTLTPTPGDVEKNLSKSTIVGRIPPYAHSPILRQVLTVVLGLVVCGVCYAACRSTILMASSYIAGHRDLVAPSVDLMAATPSFENAQISVALSSTPVVTVDALLPKSLATVAPGDHQSSLSLPYNEMLVNKSDRFQVQVIGDCHMIIKAPAKLKVKRRDPSFKVSVTRGTKLLDNLSLSKLFDGVYTVQIDREDAYGLLNVTITMAKAGIIEEHEVDFGTPWLKVAGWKRIASLAHANISTAQQAALAVVQHLTTVLESQSRVLANFTSSIGPLYGGAAQQTEAIWGSVRVFALAVAERARIMSEELRTASARHHLFASKALTENIELVQRTLVESSTAIMKQASHLGEASLRALAKAQARAKQIAKEKKQRKYLPKAAKAAKAAAGSRCGRKGKKCNR